MMKDKNSEEHIKLQVVERNGCEQVYGPPTEEANEKLPPSNLQGDWWNFFLLTVLYVLQVIPVRMALAMPVILQSRGVSSSDQVGCTISYVDSGLSYDNGIRKCTIHIFVSSDKSKHLLVSGEFRILSRERPKLPPPPTVMYF